MLPPPGTNGYFRKTPWKWCLSKLCGARICALHEVAPHLCSHTLPRDQRLAGGLGQR